MALKPLRDRVPAYIKVFQTRAQFRDAFKAEAPIFDYSSPVKDWIDTREFADVDTEVEYIGVKIEANGEPVYDSNRVVTLNGFRLFPDVAATINLLPEPVPAQGALTPAQLRMIQRKRSWPLELKTGERVVLAPGIGTIPVVDDGIADAGAPVQGGSFTEADRITLNDARKLALASASRLGRIEELLVSFQSPVPTK